MLEGLKGDLEGQVGGGYDLIFLYTCRKFLSKKDNI